MPAEPDASATLVTRRDAAHASFLRLMDDKRYEEAVAVARDVVALTRELHGEQSIELASPLTNLATAEMHHGDLAAAETRYREGIALVELREGIASPRLVNPLVGLAETYMRGGYFAPANEAYRRALQVNHAQAGFYNLEQVPILDGLSESYLGLDRLSEANAQQRTQVAIQQRHSGKDSPEVVPALYKLGRWYNRTGQYPESRESWQLARRILRESGADDLTLVDALLGEARSYLNEGAVPASASTLKRALEITEEAPAQDRRKHAEVLVALGDLYTVSRQFRTARQRYGQAWSDLSESDELLAARDGYFAEPTLISGPLLPKAIGSDGDELRTAAVPGGFATGNVLATFTVTAEGEATGARIIEADPPGLLDQAVLRTLDVSAFRPRLEAGIPVATHGVQFRHEFRYTRPPSNGSKDAGEERPAAGQAGEPIRYPDSPDEQPGLP